MDGKKTCRFRTGFTAVDVTVILAALCLAALLFVLPFITGGGADTLTVRYGDESSSYSLAVNRVFTVSTNGYTLTVEIKDGKARVADSDCPNRVCVNTGYISKPGESAVCAPAGVVLTVEGGGNGEDALAG